MIILITYIQFKHFWFLFSVTTFSRYLGLGVTGVSDWWIIIIIKMDRNTKMKNQPEPSFSLKKDYVENYQSASGFAACDHIHRISYHNLSRLKHLDTPGHFDPIWDLRLSFIALNNIALSSLLYVFSSEEDAYTYRRFRRQMASVSQSHRRCFMESV